MPIELPVTIDNKQVVTKTVGKWTSNLEKTTLRYTVEDDVKIVDLTQQSLNLKQPQPMINYVLVNDETAMRIDVISKIAMGSILHIEKMLKFNDISNPFTIDVGDLLFVPDLMYANLNMQSPDAARNRQKLDIRNQYIDPEKASKIDPNLGKFDARDKPKAADPTKLGPALPPNFANIGDKEIEIKGGKIFFGPNVSKNGNECDEPLSKSEFLAKLIKNRINK